METKKPGLKNRVRKYEFDLSALGFRLGRGRRFLASSLNQGIGCVGGLGANRHPVIRSLDIQGEFNLLTLSSRDVGAELLYEAAIATATRFRYHDTVDGIVGGSTPLKFDL